MGLSQLEASLKDMRAELNQVRRQIASLREDLLKLRKAMNEYRQKRDELNSRVKELSEQLKELKKQRDENNSKVAFYKEIRQNLREKRKGLLEEYRSLKTTVSRPKSSSKRIRQMIDRLEWRLQTVPMTIEQENALVARIKELEEKLDEIKEQEVKYQRCRSSSRRRNFKGYHLDTRFS